jgi:hypothetical protein
MKILIGGLGIEQQYRKRGGDIIMAPSKAVDQSMMIMIATVLMTVLMAERT